MCADLRSDWCTISCLLRRVKPAYLTPTTVQEILVSAAKGAFYTRLDVLQHLIPAASAEALDKMLEAWSSADSYCQLIPGCKACGHLRQVAQHEQVRNLSAASHGRLLVLSSTHQGHEMITELVLGSSSSTGTSSSSSVEKAEMVQQALKYAVEGYDSFPVYDDPLLQSNMLRLLQHSVAQHELSLEAAQGLVLLAKEKRCVWALKALLEHLPAARMVPEGVVDAWLQSSLQGKLEDDDDALTYSQTTGITAQPFLQQLPGALFFCSLAARQKLNAEVIERDTACCQLLRDHYGAMPGGDLSNG